MNVDYYISARKFAMEYGTFLGLAWLLDFHLLTKGIDNSPFLLLTGCCLFLFLPILTFYMAFRFKQHQCAGERKTAGCAAYFTIMMFVFAEIVSFFGEYAYFAYLDQGHIIAAFQAMLEHPAIVEQYRSMGMTEFLNTANSQLEQLSALSPFELASNLSGSNVLTCFILFVPTWMIAMKKAVDYAKKYEEINKKRREMK